ncbi:MAG: paraquat-inducible protein A [Agarilytica sp.]
MSQVHAEQKDWLMCHECGELQAVVALSPEHEMVCCMCGNSLHVGHGKWLEAASALAITAAVLFGICQLGPFMTLEIGSQSQTITILDGFWALFDRGNWVLAALVLTTTFLFPLFEVVAILYILIPYNFKRRLRGQRSVLRWLVQMQSWSMLEVFLLSMVVASVKMADMAELKLELGAYALFLLVGVLILAFIKMDRRKLWSWINTNNYYTSYNREFVYDCHICQAMVGQEIVEEKEECPRCETKLYKRIPNSIQKTTALVFASFILYVPANILPIMTYTSLGVTETDTIFSGVVALIGAGLYWIAVVVFVASIAVPVLKLVILSYLILAVQAKWTRGIKQRAFLYRLTEIVGRWSMVDVFVVTIFTAIVQFGFVYTVEPEGAIIAFGAVVVLTMIAAETFDPRLLWDALEEDNEK